VLNKKIENEIQKRLLQAVKLLNRLECDDWASDVEATAFAIRMDFEKEDEEYRKKYGFSHREIEL
jgi:hypothetical protein